MSPHFQPLDVLTQSCDKHFGKQITLCMNRHTNTFTHTAILLSLTLKVHGARNLGGRRAVGVGCVWPWHHLELERRGGQHGQQLLVCLFWLPATKPANPPAKCRASQFESTVCISRSNNVSYCTVLYPIRLPLCLSSSFASDRRCVGGQLWYLAHFKITLHL